MKGGWASRECRERVHGEAAGENIKHFGGMIEDDGELAPAGGELARRCGGAVPPCHAGTSA